MSDICKGASCSRCKPVPHCREEAFFERQVSDLREVIADALSVLGTGECNINTCDGCKHELQTAIADLRNALKKEYLRSS